MPLCLAWRSQALCAAVRLLNVASSDLQTAHKPEVCGITAARDHYNSNLGLVAASLRIRGSIAMSDATPNIYSGL